MGGYFTILFLVFIFTIVIIVLIDLYINKFNNDKPEKEIVIYKPFLVRHIAGLDINSNSLCNISFTNKRIIINQIKDDKILKTFSISNNKVDKLAEDTIVENKLISGDSIGNALLGGLLFGSVGAIVGATSGTSIKSIKCDIDVLKIIYNSNNVEKCILLSSEDKFNYNGFIKSYNKRILEQENLEIENIEL